MKIGEENNVDEFGRRIGYGFGYFEEYSLSALDLNKIDKGNYDELYVLTDQDDYKSVIEYSFDDGILIDIFQHQVLCDLFICYLKWHLKHNTIEDEFRKQLEDWYLSDVPKYKVMNNYEI